MPVCARIKKYPAQLNGWAPKSERFPVWQELFYKMISYCTVKGFMFFFHIKDVIINI